MGLMCTRAPKGRYGVMVGAFFLIRALGAGSPFLGRPEACCWVVIAHLAYQTSCNCLLGRPH